MTRMQKHWDVIFGAGGVAATWGLTRVNLFLAFVAGVLTVFILTLRLAREWRNRNKPPE